MIKLFATCIMSGTTFSPRATETLIGIPLKEKVEPGGFSARGRFRDTPAPDGSAELRPDCPGEDYSSLERLVDLVGEKKAALYASGVDDFKLYVAISYCQQCNLEFSSRLLSKIAQLDIPLLISAYESEDKIG